MFIHLASATPLFTEGCKVRVKERSATLVAGRLVLKHSSMEVKMSKHLAHRLGLDKDKLFDGVSIVDLTNAMVFSSRMLANGYHTINKYSKYKVREIYKKLYGVRLHRETVGHYVDTLTHFGLATVENNTLHFKTLKSKRKERNFIIEFSDYASIRAAAIEFAKYIFSATMRAIGYVMELKCKIKNPHDKKEHKQSIRRSRSLGFDIDEFYDNGVTYETLAARFGISKSYVSRYIKICEQAKIFRKEPNRHRDTYKNASRFVGSLKKLIHCVRDNCQFYVYYSDTDTLYSYKILANTYVYNPYDIPMLRYDNYRAPKDKLLVQLEYENRQYIESKGKIIA